LFLLEQFIKEVQDRIGAEKDALARGVAKSFEEYKKGVGTIEGLGKALNILEELIKKTPKEERY
jgi:hypothetical protein